MKVRPGKIAVALIGSATFGALAGEDLPVMGTAWYPEMWPAECRANDLDLMQKARFSSVRIGEFNWAGFEPREGEYDFEDFKSVLDELARRGMTAMMCTATAAPPRWFLLKYPEAWKVTDTKGGRLPIEHRRQYCANNPDFRRAARARALGDALVRVQRENGRIQTVLSARGEDIGCDWVNCMIATAGTLQRLASFSGKGE